MSDMELARVLDDMERLLQEEPFPVDPGAIEAWRTRFAEAVASAEHGPEWPELVRRARELSRRVEAIVATLAEKRDSLRIELGAQAQGARALKGYRPPGN